MVDSTEIDLGKIDKLLDKIQKDIKKYHAEEGYDESEKYISHIQKTTELYSLTLTEIIGSLEMTGLNQYSKVTKKLFKGMQYQIMSILKFGLYHFKRQHFMAYQEQLRQEQQNIKNMQQESTLALIDQETQQEITIPSENKIKKGQYTHLNSNNNIEGKSTPSIYYNGNQKQGGTPRANQANQTLSGFSKANKTGNTTGLNLQAQSLSNFRVAYGSQFNSINNKLNGEYSQDMILMTTNRNTLDDQALKESFNNLLTNEDDEEEMKEFFFEHEKMQHEISEVLNRKQLVNKLIPGTKVSNNLKEILNDLESTQKNVTLITQGRRSNENSDDEMTEPAFREMGERIKKAFNQAKDKAAHNIEELLKLKNAQAPKKKPEIKGKAVKGKGGKTAGQIVMKDAETMIWEELGKPKGESKRGSNIEGADAQEFKNQIRELKEKMAQIEKEKSDKGDKYSKLVTDYQQCAQEKRDAWVKIRQLEIEVEELKESLKILKHHEAELKLNFHKMQDHNHPLKTHNGIPSQPSVHSKQDVQHGDHHFGHNDPKENIIHSPSETSVVNHPVLELEDSRSHPGDLDSFGHIPASIQNSRVNLNIHDNQFNLKIPPQGNLDRGQEGFSPQVQIKNLSSIYKSNGNNSIYQNVSQLSQQNRVLGEDTARSEAISNFNQGFPKREEESIEIEKQESSKKEPSSLNQSKHAIKVVENNNVKNSSHLFREEGSNQQPKQLLIKQEDISKKQDIKNKKDKILPNDIMSEQETEKDINKGSNKTSGAEKNQISSGKAYVKEGLNNKKIPTKPENETTSITNSVEKGTKIVQNENQKQRKEERSPEVQRQERQDAIKQEKEQKSNITKSNTKDSLKNQRLQDKSQNVKSKEHNTGAIDKSPELPKQEKDSKPKAGNKKEDTDETQNQSQQLSPKSAKIAQTNRRQGKSPEEQKQDRIGDVFRTEKDPKTKSGMSNTKNEKNDKSEIPSPVTPKALKSKQTQQSFKIEETKPRDIRNRDRSPGAQRFEKDSKGKSNTSSNKTILPIISPSGSKNSTPLYRNYDDKPKDEIVLITQTKVNKQLSSKDSSMKSLNEKKLDSISVFEDYSDKNPKRNNEFKSQMDITVRREEDNIPNEKQKSLSEFKAKPPAQINTNHFEQTKIDRETSPRKGRKLLELSDENKVLYQSNLVSPGPKSLKGLPPALFKSPQNKIGREGWKEGGTSSAGYLFSGSGYDSAYSKHHLQPFSATDRHLPQMNRDKKVGKSLQFLNLKDEKEQRHQQNISAEVPFLTIKKQILNENYLYNVGVVGILPDNKRSWQEVVDQKKKRMYREGVLHKGRTRFALTLATFHDFNPYEDGYYTDSSGARFYQTNPRGVRSDFIIESLSIRQMLFGGMSSGYNSDNEGSNEARHQYRHKMTIDECIRKEIIREHEQPAQSSEERQLRVMYRSMLAKAKQYPKLINYIQRIVLIDPEVMINPEHPVVEYDVFVNFVRRYMQIHAKCGDNCSHMMKFYAKIGYHAFWNNRSPMMIKRTEIGHVSNMTKAIPKFPTIIKKKKELGVKDAA